MDIADEAIEEARRRVSSAEFHSGNILEMGLPHNSFGVVVTLETFSHVANQPQLVEVIANLLHDRGYLILTTQNRSIYMRNSRIVPPAEGQLRRWVTMQELGDDAGIAAAAVGAVRLPVLKDACQLFG